MNQIELLAPAGSTETLIAAVNGGANAIYLGGKSFGARRSAQNFSNEEIAEAIKYCHERNVSVYVTVNTLIKDDELEEVMAFIEFLYQNDVDAVILQDIGLLHLVKKQFPDLHCHASTQMTFHDLAGVKTAQRLGFSRVVLSRELSFEEIKFISETVAIELEFFVHGALCISYSGQCQMSSFIGGRSGNRGACAQPCRKQYTVINNTTGQRSNKAYLMSPKDLMTYEQIDKLRLLKNVSFKIEGRMKGSDYVFSIVDMYRKGLDQGFLKDQVINFSRTFNRQFTTGFMFDDAYTQIMNYEIPGSFGMPVGTLSMLSDGQLTLKLVDALSKGDEIQFRSNGETVGTRTDVILRDGIRVSSAEKGDIVAVPFKHNAPKGALFYKTYDRTYIDEMIKKSQVQRAVHTVHFKCTIKLGEKVKLESHIDGSERIYDFESECLAEVAQNRPLDEMRLIEQLSKLGGTPFHVGKIEIHLEENLSVPISALNLLRRKCLDAILDDLKVRYKARVENDSAVNQPPISMRSKNQATINDSSLNCKTIKVAASKPIMMLVFDKVDQLLKALSERRKRQTHEQAFQIDFYLTDLDGYFANLETLKRESVVPVLPRIIRSDETHNIETFIKAYATADARICLSHIGQLEWVKGLPLNLTADYSMNAFNAASGDALNALGFDQIIWSSELSKDELKKMKRSLNGNGIFVYGHLPLMISEYCPVGGVFTGHDKCGLCAKNTFSLIDEKGAVFPLACDPSHCRTEVLSNVPISLLDQVPMLIKNGFDMFRVSMDAFNSESTEILHKLFDNSQMDAILTDSHSRGNFNRGIE